MEEREELLYIIKTDDGKYWRRNFPYWVERVNYVSPLKKEEAQGKLIELESQVKSKLAMILLSDELSKG
ncbi:hypothetical protein [Niallia sp. NCCP-28]|uniref:hypothetical protein n=1 Tax=Niallia sp. NCCP-28 TaxID=2934712 RepID=UPI00208132EC|nr:hypothetical protein [Niallia sp. NCCP-28]GKU84017.1 hypothetical protein NCCP28_34130 [Niallia sp. NCCP-28]